MSENIREKANTESKIPKAPKSPGRVEAAANRPRLPGERGFQPGQPTNGPDLIATWELPSQAHTSGRLKVSRKKYPTGELELLAEMLVQDYNLTRLAHDFGPGEFYLLLSADPQQLWKMRNCKIIVSPEYAAQAGYQTYPPERQPVQSYMPRISEANALQAAAGALGGDRPLTVRDLAQLVEMVSDKTAEAIQRRQAQQLPPMQGDPMQFFGAVLKMQQSMEDRAFQVAERLLNGRADNPEPAESSFSKDIMGLVPLLLAAFKKPEPPLSPIQRAPIVGEGPAPIQEAPPMQPQIQIPMTEDEAARFSLAVNMLRPWVPHIVQAMAQEPDTAKVAADFERFIPPALEQQLTDLDRLAQERGPAVLALIHPDLATSRGAELIQKIAVILTQV
jgi:hypothetical protein